jgi:hypothetical protein
MKFIINQLESDGIINYISQNNSAEKKSKVIKIFNDLYHEKYIL